MMELIARSEFLLMFLSRFSENYDALQSNICTIKESIIPSEQLTQSNNCFPERRQDKTDFMYCLRDIRGQF